MTAPGPVVASIRFTDECEEHLGFFDYNDNILPLTFDPDHASGSDTATWVAEAYIRSEAALSGYDDDDIAATLRDVGLRLIAASERIGR